MSFEKQWIYGLHAVLAILEQQPERIIRLCVLDKRDDRKLQAILNLAKQSNLVIEFCSKTLLESLISSTTHDINHQGVIACCKSLPQYTEQDLERFLTSLTASPFILMLDGVQDPHNLGACFRSAAAAGVQAIIVPKDKSVSLTATVSKVASGAAERIPFIQVTNLVRTIEMLKQQGIWIYGAAGDAPQSLFQAKMKGPLAIVLGAEGTGLRRLTREHCDALLHIPMQGAMSSLNVSVAAGIFLFEVVRQRF